LVGKAWREHRKAYGTSAAAWLEPVALEELGFGEPLRTTPEKALWITCLQMGLLGVIKGGKSGQRELRWLLSEKIFEGSFRWICMALEIECYERIRENVMHRIGCRKAQQRLGSRRRSIKEQ